MGFAKCCAVVCLAFLRFSRAICRFFVFFQKINMSNLCLQHVGALFIFVTKNVVLNEFTMLSCTIAVTMQGFIPALMLSFSYSKGFNKKIKKKKDHELNAMANISAKRFFVENASLKFRRPPFFIGLEFIFAPEVYRVFIFLSILLCFLNMFRIKGLQLFGFHALL